MLLGRVTVLMTPSNGLPLCCSFVVSIHFDSLLVLWLALTEVIRTNPEPSLHPFRALPLIWEQTHAGKHVQQSWIIQPKLSYTSQSSANLPAEHIHVKKPRWDQSSLAHITWPVHINHRAIRYNNWLLFYAAKFGGYLLHTRTNWYSIVLYPTF